MRPPQTLCSTVPRAHHGSPFMLKATDGEIEDVRKYFEWQAPDLEVTFMQKVYSEAVLNTRHDVWDIHTNKDRWWVITGGTKPLLSRAVPEYGPCSQPFHIGLILRIPAYGRTAAGRVAHSPVRFRLRYDRRGRQRRDAGASPRGLSGRRRPLPRGATRAHRRRAGRGKLDRRTAAARELPRLDRDHLQ